MFFIFMLFLEVKTCKYIHIHKQIPPNDHDGSTRKVWMRQWDTYFKRLKSKCFEIYFLNFKGSFGATLTKNIDFRPWDINNQLLCIANHFFKLFSKFCTIFPDFFYITSITWPQAFISVRGWSFKGPENGHYGYDHIAHPGETFGGLTEFRLLASLTTTTSMSENFFLFFSLLETRLVVMVIF